MEGTDAGDVATIVVPLSMSLSYFVSRKNGRRVTSAEDF